MTAYLCKLKANPCKTTTGTLAGVTLSQFHMEVERDEKGKPTGARWLREPLQELSPETVAAFKERLPHAVLRPGAGIVKLDATRNPDGSRRTLPPSEGDLPLADFIEFRPWEGPTPVEVAALQAENVTLKARLAALEQQAETDDADEQAERSDAVVAGRTPGPRNRHPRPTNP